MKKYLEKRKWAVLLVLTTLFCFTTGAVAQQRTITGAVTDNTDGSPLVGATIMIKGKTQGTFTDAEGKYSIKVNNEDVLEFRYVGYLNEEVLVGTLSQIDVRLVIDATKMEEIVVVGYGTVKKKDLTGSVFVINANEISKTTGASFESALQGRAPGVVVTQTSGKPGAGMSIRVRGIGSINASAEPLYVIDGVFMGGGENNGTSALASISSNDIESINILKDASATAIYGAQGANGVVVITTKRGEKGKSKVSVQVTSGISTMPVKFDMMNADEYSQFYLDAGNADGRDTIINYTSDYRKSLGNINTDWIKKLTNQGYQRSVNVSVSGGGESSNFSVSSNYYKEKGLLIDNSMERFGLRANSDFKVGKKLKIGESLNLSRVNANLESHFTNGGPWASALLAAPIMPVYDPTSNDGLGFAGPTSKYTAVNEQTNVVAEQLLNSNNAYTTSIMVSLYGDFQIMNGLNFKSTFSADYGLSDVAKWSPKYKLGDLGGRVSPTSKLTNEANDAHSYMLDEQLTYTKAIANHNISITAVHSSRIGEGTYFGATGTDFQNPDYNVLSQAGKTESVSGGKSIFRMESYLARANYDFKGKYLATASIRYDGSTHFLQNQWGSFPSFSLGWKFNEDLLNSPKWDWLNMAKVRFGWGITGNQNVGDFRYASYISPQNQFWYTFGANQHAVNGAAVYYQPGNPLLKWESARMVNYGIDLNIFKNSLQMSAEYYVKNQDKMLTEVQMSSIYGLSGDQSNVWVNLGALQNKGFDFNVSWKKTYQNFNYGISANLTTIKNVVKSLPGDPIISTLDMYTLGNTITKVGHSVGSFYGFIAEGIFQTPEEVKSHASQVEGSTSPGDIKYKDLNQDGVINDDDRTIIGKPTPDFVYGLNLEAAYRGIDFSLFFNGMQNMSVYASWKTNIAIATDPGQDWNKLRSVKNYWTKENHSNTMTRPSVDDKNLNERPSTWFLEDASFLKIKNVQLGYTFSNAFNTFLNISRLRIYVSVSNVYTFTKYDGYDPEVGSLNVLTAGIDNNSYPIPRTFLGGIQLDF